jgi:hypothetical protein
METAGLVKVADELELQKRETNSWKDWQQLNREPDGAEQLMNWRIGTAEEPVELSTSMLTIRDRLVTGRAELVNWRQSRMKDVE